MVATPSVRAATIENTYDRRGSDRGNRL